MLSVFFRAFELEDAILIHKWKNDFFLLEQAVGMERCTSYQENLEWVKDKTRHDPFNIYWAICANDESKTMIGYTSFNDIHYVNRSVNSGGLVIGDENYRDGTIWVECYLLIMKYAFETLGLNRLYGNYLEEQTLTAVMAQDIMFFSKEGVLKNAILKNGEYKNLACQALLKEDYYLHKQSGDYEIKSILKRVRLLKKNSSQK